MSPPERQSRRRGTGGKVSTSTLTIPPGTVNSPARRRYVEALVRPGRQAGSVPPFGSPEWERLPDRDPRKVAAVVAAAEAWYLDRTPEVIARQLHDELAAEAQVEQAWVAEVAEAVRRVADRPTFAELRRRWGEAS